MLQILENEKKVSHLVTPLLFGIIIAAIVSYVVFFITPVIGELPVEITEEVEILAVTEKGVVIETSSGVAVTTNQYDGQIGDLIEVTYSVPTKYLKDKIDLQVRYNVFHPGS